MLMYVCDPVVVIVGVPVFLLGGEGSNYIFYVWYVDIFVEGWKRTRGRLPLLLVFLVKMYIPKIRCRKPRLALILLFCIWLSYFIEIIGIFY